jgi:hypothetical protein
MDCGLSFLVFDMFLLDCPFSHPSDNPSEAVLTDQKDPSRVEIMTGYDKLTALIGKYPSLAIYRRFGALSAKVLLNRT